jgi:hypothetical protein
MLEPCTALALPVATYIRTSYMALPVEKLLAPNNSTDSKEIGAVEVVESVVMPIPPISTNALAVIFRNCMEEVTVGSVVLNIVLSLTLRGGTSVKLRKT